MGEDQKLRGLKLVAAGLVFGRLATVGFRRRGTRAPVTQARAEQVKQSGVIGPVAASWQYAGNQPKRKAGNQPKRKAGNQPKRKAGNQPKTKLAFLTNNAVVAGVVSAIVAGIISLLVIHYQSHAAARQAVFEQQIQVASQMEATADVFYDTIVNDYNFWINCDTGDNFWPPACPQPAGFNDFAAERNKLAAVEFNISDANALTLAVDFEGAGLQILHADSRQSAQKEIDIFTTEYLNLITRCGQIIQGQQEAYAKPSNPAAVVRCDRGAVSTFQRSWARRARC